jgi:hypothetical protein
MIKKVKALDVGIFVSSSRLKVAAKSGKEKENTVCWKY